MRKLLLSFLTFLLISVTSFSQKTLLAGWTFDAITAAPNTPTSVLAEYGVYSSSALYADGTNGSSSWITATTGNELTSFSGATLNDPRATTTATQAYSLLNSTANGKAIVFKTSTLYYRKIRISFDTRGTSTGFTTQQYWYSTDGSTWTNFAGYTPSTSGFVTKTFDLTAVTSLDNKANIYFKISFTGASAATGNNRIDNVQITSDDATWFGTTSVDYSITSNWIPAGINSTYSSVPNSTSVNAVILASANNPVVAATLSVGNCTLMPSARLNVQAGNTLTVGGILTLKSSASGTAIIGNNTGVLSAPTVVVERYIPGGRRAFRFLSHPFSSSLALSSLTDDIDITGDGGTSPMTTTGSNNPSAFGYDNTSANSSLASDPGWTALTSTSTFDPKKGYRILVRGAKGEGLNGAAYTPSTVTLSWTGTLNSGDQVVTLANNGTNRDYTLVGNPYASPVDLSLVTRGSNINANFYVWDPNLSTSGAYVTNAFSSSYILPSGGAFFTQSAANTNNTITFIEASKAVSTPSSLFRTITQAEDKLVLQVNDANNNYADRLDFYFDNKKYTDNTDALWDAAKMNNPDVNFYSFSADAKKLAIDRRPTPNQNIALGFTAKTLGNYTIVVNELPNKGTYYLRDNYLQTETALEANTNIAITVTTEAASQGTSRFELVMKASPVALPTSTLEVKMSPNPVKDVLTVSYSNPTEAIATVRIINSKGQILQTQSLGNTAAGNQAINMAKYGKGVYTVELTIGKERISKQVVKN